MALTHRPPDTEPPIRARLASNEFAFGPLPGIPEAMAADDAIVRYPDPAVTALRTRLATVHDVRPEQVAVGNGSVSLIQQAILATTGPRSEILIGDPSFSAYSELNALTGARIRTTPLRGTGLDLEAMAAAVTDRTRIAFVCTPNNPTGGVVTDDDLRRFLATVPESVLVVVDEAYREFVDVPDAADGARHVRDHPNVLVLRTFSKAYGLAGLRVGFAIGDASVIAAVEAFRPPYGVNGPGQRAALLSLDRVPDVTERVLGLVVERERFRERLRSNGIVVPPSQANFLWIPAGERSADLARSLRRVGVAVLPVPSHGIRATVGTPAENDILVEELVGLR